ncbi:hypothetical protein DB30_04893 [Enhygromyxa salina]|uniref:DUF2934 domain-containing protein n=1 Tax=Enhygromyxa salina TaxID=215803 RepID=A0A0C2D353_9BACT|nr:DUF2934 domain-containing protein [Enhygromyxa salina]KIG16175.1 hypothetical protein DB30_04893 [Enhygromyxa salina]
MPYDITMCPGDGCPLRAGCYRHRGVPVGRQSWFVTPPYNPASQQCPQLLALPQIDEAQIRERAYMIWMAAGRAGDAEQHWHQAKAELEAAAQRALRPLEEPSTP